jgi:hypothetical protein
VLPEGAVLTQRVRLAETLSPSAPRKADDDERTLILVRTSRIRRQVPERPARWKGLVRSRGASLREGGRNRFPRDAEPDRAASPGGDLQKLANDVALAGFLPG